MRWLTCFLVFFPVAALLLPGAAHAQSFTLKGIIVKSQGNERLAQVRVTDLKTHEVRLTDEHGMFTIPTALDDTLQFNKADFNVINQPVTSSNDMVIYLQPVIALNTVVVKGSSTRQDQQEALDAYRSKGVYNNGKSGVLASIASPLNALYDVFGKDAKRARRFSADVKSENEASAVDRRFSRSLVKQVTALPDEELTQFMETYRPSYQDITKWSDYELITYIKKSLMQYKNDKVTKG